MVAHMPARTLKEMLTETLEARGLTLERLAELTDIPERFLVALSEGDMQRLPPAPYVRGYLKRIADFLGMDGQALWRLFREEHPVRAPGVADRLPSNRFIIQSEGKKWIIIVLVFLAILYIALRLPSLIGTPSLELEAPDAALTTTSASPLRLSGRVSAGDSLLINKENISVDADGRFQKEWPLEPGLNTFEFAVKKFLGREIKITRQVIYQP